MLSLRADACGRRAVSSAFTRKVRIESGADCRYCPRLSHISGCSPGEHWSKTLEHMDDCVKQGIKSWHHTLKLGFHISGMRMMYAETLRCLERKWSTRFTFAPIATWSDPVCRLRKSHSQSDIWNRSCLYLHCAFYATFAYHIPHWVCGIIVF